MIIACMIVSCLALLTAVANIILFFVEKKRVNKRHSVTVDFITTECEAVSKAAAMYAEEYTGKKIEESTRLIMEDVDSVGRKIARRFERNEEEIKNLKSGTIPDYETALSAAKAVNDFNAGISAIMNYDPIAAVRAQRQSVDKEADEWLE
jgi:hypothetical protein